MQAVPSFGDLVWEAFEGFSSEKMVYGHEGFLDAFFTASETLGKTEAKVLGPLSEMQASECPQPFV